MITIIVLSWIVTVLAVAGSILYADSCHHEVKNLRANTTALQNKLALEVQANTRLEIENARLLVEMKDLRKAETRRIDSELAAKAKAVAA